MKKILTQYYTIEQKEIFDLVNQNNLSYALLKKS